MQPCPASRDHDAATARVGPTRDEHGASLAGLLVVVALIALVVTFGAGSLAGYRSRTGLASTVQVARTALYQARMLSVYRGARHFLVLDPLRRTIEIYEDSSAPVASFDAGDALVTRTSWSPAVDLDLPGAGSLTDPLVGASVTDAWELPRPDSSARWGGTLLGVMTTPQGRISSAAATPQTIGIGTVVFHDGKSGTAALAIDGRSGFVAAYRWRAGAWEPL